MLLLLLLLLPDHIFYARCSPAVWRQQPGCKGAEPGQSQAGFFLFASFVFGRIRLMTGARNGDFHETLKRLFHRGPPSNNPTSCIWRQVVSSYWCFFKSQPEDFHKGHESRRVIICEGRNRFRNNDEPEPWANSRLTAVRSENREKGKESFDKFSNLSWNNQFHVLVNIVRSTFIKWMLLHREPWGLSGWDLHVIPWLQGFN